MSSMQNLLKKYHITPQRHRGQNFLIDQNILKKIITAANVEKKETVVEIGAGLGVLTRALAGVAGRVIAIELDKSLSAILTEELADLDMVELIQDDARDVPHSRFGKKDGSYCVVANIPYNITSQLIRSFLEMQPRPSRMVLLVQKEVAQRMCAPKGSILSLAVQYFAKSTLLFSVSPNCFFPKPKVESAVVRLDLHAKFPSPKEQAAFFSVLKAGFAAKRKKLSSNLIRGLSLDAQTVADAFTICAISPLARAEELTLAQWKHLSETLHLDRT